jgi:hypothetical protein
MWLPSHARPGWRHRRGHGFERAHGQHGNERKVFSQFLNTMGAAGRSLVRPHERETFFLIQPSGVRRSCEYDASLEQQTSALLLCAQLTAKREPRHRRGQDNAHWDGASTDGVDPGTSAFSTMAGCHWHYS